MSRSAAPRAAAVLTAVAAGGLLAVAVAPAQAAYPPAQPTCSVTTSSGLPDRPVTVSGVGFPAGSTVTVGGSGSAVITNPSTKAGTDGSVRVGERIGKAGTATYTLSGTTGSARCTARAVEVQASTTAPAPPPPPPLPFTGAAGVIGGSILGAGLLATGGVLVVAGRRRSRRTAA